MTPNGPGACPAADGGYPCQAQLPGRRAVAPQSQAMASRSARPAGAAAYLATKADLLDRIAASREQDGRARCDIDTARQAAAAARSAADTVCARERAVGVMTGEVGHG